MLGFPQVAVFKPLWIEHLDVKPIWVESRKQLREECEKRGAMSRWLL